MRYFTFRFLHSRRHELRDFTVCGTHEDEARTAAWNLLRGAESHAGVYLRDEWRLLSTVIRPTLDLADTVSV